jgi:hypothetical protein
MLVLLLVANLYEQVTSLSEKNAPAPYTSLMLLFLLITLAALVFRLPRWVVYLTLSTLLLIHIAFYTFEISRLEQDRASTRDAAVELSAQAFLRRENPWSHVQLNVPVSTGPASVLLALPFVALFGNINALTFIFWVAFLLILLVADLQRGNRTFPLLALLSVSGIFGFRHTLYWSLEELYFPILLFAFAYLCLQRNGFLLAGALLFTTAMFRLNYVFLIIAFLLWYFYHCSTPLKGLIWMTLGGILASLLVLAPFIIVAGKEFVHQNPFLFALKASGSTDWTPNNPIFISLRLLSRLVGSRAMRLVKLLLIVPPLMWFSWKAPDLDHPFWHLTLAALLTLLFAWFPSSLPTDYELFLILPAFLGIAFSDRGGSCLTTC